MTFNSLQYAAFLPCVFLLYWALGHRQQNILLLGGSYLFYGTWDWRFLGLLLFSSVVDFVIGRQMGRAGTDRHRRSLLLTSLVVNLGVLGFFKYFNFFVDSATELLGAVGLAPATPVVEVLLPVGISFYTFQSLSYTIDVYRRRLEPTESLLDFCAFVAFFPQLVAGPIERATHLLPEIQRTRRRPRWYQVRSGCVLILLGLFKKVVIADALAPVVNEAFAQGEAGSGHWLALLVGAYAFALQIYGDFSGYSDIARGSSRLFGIELMRNFEQPYLSRSITEFWRRWHISLSSWLRDYLYVPLGGNRRGPRRTSINLALTMLLGGLWHGAAWTFVAWGALHGLYLMVDRWTGRERPDVDRPVGAGDLASILWTFHLVCLAWVFFRAGSIGGAFSYVLRILTFGSGSVVLGSVLLVGLAALAVIAVDLGQRTSGHHDVVLRWPELRRGLVYGVAVAGIVLFSGGSPVPFIYFQF
ncbi:MAG: Probable poly(beta-D-mannuronate) O-acetylase [uncultured Acidimicrobiales bacterium]|uniref:Probable poly(Beta-D-mannuronate) O-acetylase n=1 Tax=uncultured Acidimicrobiales bacterium TaxID=310071 RepID=A0A6J4I758_9ACTN|nr:MAG: Probable poly(beta-D-mannuronate) O-acetylase [uncultured Acidimicrobiales bacterium]